MPVDWAFADHVLCLGGTGKYRIAPDDEKRQTLTAQSILEQLRDQPGVVLADEVGMGKTYVALAVIASVLLSTPRSGDPVVVMVPPGLARKWQREWQRFKSSCTTGGGLAWMDGRDRFAPTPTEFFKLLDGPRDRRPRLIWVTTSCFSQGLGDGWMKLALVRLARSHTKMDAEAKMRLYKWATTLTQLKSKRGLTAESVERLMVSDPLQWKRILVEIGALTEDADEPVPEHLVRHAGDLDWKPLADILRGDVPGRRGQVSTERLRDARVAFNEECQKLYWAWLSCAKWRAALVVLDEAHHAKNDGTRLASLFRSEDSIRLIAGQEDEKPLFWRKADRMLFLTATPFQLGHHELIRVLRSFSAIRWTGESAPTNALEALTGALEILEARLNANRLAGRRLDSLWGRLSPEHVGGDGATDLLDAVSKWWAQKAKSVEEPLIDELRLAVDECRRTKREAECDTREPWNGLQNWVVRHNRAATMPGENGEQDVPRRLQRLGNSILSAGEEPSGDSAGISIGGTSALPFLLAARAQAELAASPGRARAYFAEGLSSSYEAFHHTRDQRGDVSEGDPEASDSSGDGAEDAAIVPLEWYEGHVSAFVPTADEDLSCFEHPKVHAVVQRAVSLWLSGEKVVIFCFYRQTVKALREHLRREVDRAIAKVATRRLEGSVSEDEAHHFLERVARRLADAGSPFNAELHALLGAELDAQEFQILTPFREKILGALAAYVRTPAFIARYLPLDVPEVREALSTGSTRADVVRHGTAALRRGCAEATDGSGLTMLARVREFLRFAVELADNGGDDDPDNDGERRSPLEEYLAATTVDVNHRDDDEEEGSAPRKREHSYRALPTVRMVYGGTRRDVRERVMLAFNSPLFPEILVSSGVLGEGVDLHRFCRHIIHHDLCWNPSTLEQRTGRVDRIRCKAEATRRSIIVYEPFLAGSADEKMFRVVRDRERWFQVVMGQKFELDERTTEALASRVPLPPSIANELLFDLRRWRSERGAS